MKIVSIEDVESTPDADAHTDRRALAEPLNTSEVAITRYVLKPGERFSGSVHAHMDQEEVFLVLEGVATFETRERTVTVGENEAIRFAPGEFQSGENGGDETVVAFALGAPRDSEDVRIDRIPVLDDRNVACPDCGHDNMRIPRGDESGSGLVCPHPECEGTLAVE
ncbi:cupin domain-containing protein [Natronoglomus mannanivorans]|uniref:Cupin domain-containing protein n=1 Tax=Natronoglomus mannanivorans TaxID=2979990 RepID=A0AAP2Z098_9EURY|nr:cupin domain-containing protein [Halobacteria archaeon AArc-xg1-1]